MRLIERLDRNYDGWILHAAATPRSIATLAPLVERTGARWMAWVKGFAAFKRNIPVAFAWEPVIVKAARKPVVSKRLVMRDWIQESITLRRGLTGAKPEAVCHWAFEMVAARPDDTLDDLFPGTGAVAEAWRTWRLKFALPDEPAARSAAPSCSGWSRTMKAGGAEKAERAEGKIKEDGTISGRFWKLLLSAHWLGCRFRHHGFEGPRAAISCKALALPGFERHHRPISACFQRFSLESRP